jgi:phage terminase large subunit
MLACLWFALDRFGGVTVFRELYEPNLIASAAAARIRALSPEPVVATYAPPDLFNRQKDTGRSMWEVFEEGGVPLVRADTNRRQGWMQVKEFLAPRGGEGEGAGVPRLQIFASCENLIRTLPALLHDKTDPCDVASEPHEYTHLPDALRYFLRSRATPAREEARAVTGHKARVLAAFNQTARKGRFN